ncbi:MAG: beta-glucosidase [Flavobacteriales bacterium]|jgi:beta-glucosidase
MQKNSYRSTRLKRLTYSLYLSALASLSGATYAEIGAEAVEAKVQAMSLEEKIDFIGGYNDFYIRGYEQYGIPQISIADGPVGVRAKGKSTAYPASINLAASWDSQIAYNTGKAMGLESRDKNVHLLLAPGMNIYRLPINGRNFEYFGEDPYLTAQTGVSFIKGLQDQGVMANAKHFVANNQEYNRHHVSSDVDERTLHEIYLPAFKAAVHEANVATVMTAYNPINGIHASEHNELNNSLLKGIWGFDGFIVSDWVSTYDAIGAVNGGLDLEMPSSAMMNSANILPAMKDGRIKKSTIDDKVRRILLSYDRFDYFEEADLRKNFTLDTDFVRQAALDAARGGMVLLKNDKKTLPLTRSDIKKLAVIGPNGAPGVFGGGGSSSVDPLHPLSLVDAIKRVAGNDIEVTYEAGVFKGLPYPGDLWDDYPLYRYENGKKVTGTDAEFYLGKNLEGDIVATRHYDWLKLENGDLWDTKGVSIKDFSVRFTSYYTPDISGYYVIGASGDDGYRVLLDNAEIVNLWRDQGPTPGKREVFMNAGQEYKVVVEYYQSGGGAMVQLGLKKANMAIEPKQYISNAVDVAKNADMVILSVGFDWSTEGESYDRAFELPYNQSDLIQAVSEVNDKVVVVLNAGGNVQMDPWLNHIDALLMAWYPGQEGNLAAAEILFGDTNPSGKLPASFEFQMEENPSFDHYFDPDGDLRVSYGEGIFLGYRYWDQASTKPRFPFGYGLSYTHFKYGKARTDKKHYTIGEPVKVSLTLKNKGKLAGAEIVQLYVSDKKSSLPRPEKELKAYKKTMLKAGEKTQLEFELDSNAFAFYNPKTHQWEVEEGEFEILLASAADDVRKRVKIKISEK